MSEIQHAVLAALTPEALSPRITRRMLWGERLMVAMIELKAGAIVPTHQHENEQLSYCTSGSMRFTFPDRELVLQQGEVLLIPGGLPHSAEMLEDVVTVDFFSPPRQDWIAGADAYLRQ